MSQNVPEDFHTITPQLVVRGVADAIAWYVGALGAHELLRHTAPDGKAIMHSELLPLWLLWYAEQPWPDALVVKQLGLELFSSLVLGMVVAAMARGTQVGSRV